MATADQITAFLSNEMSPERERQFLLAVAASDSLRLELKSQLLLDRMMGQRVHSARVPDTVRSVIFAHAGIADVSTPGASSPSAGQSASMAQAARPGFFSRFIGRATLFITTVAVFGAGYAVGTDDAGDLNHHEGQRPVSAPTVSNRDAVIEPAPSSSDVATPTTTPSAPTTASSSAGVRVTESVRSGAAVSAPTPTSVPRAADVEPVENSTQAASPASRTRTRFGSRATVRTDGTQREPTEAERNASNPLEQGGPTVR